MVAGGGGGGWRRRSALSRRHSDYTIAAVFPPFAATQAAGALAAPEEEEASEQEQVEALFTQIKLEHKNKRRPGPYYRRCAAGEALGGQGGVRCHAGTWMGLQCAGLA